MSEQESSSLKELNEPRIVTRYSRPIDFVKETKKVLEIPKNQKTSNGDEIASLYKQLISSSSSKNDLNENKGRDKRMPEQTNQDERKELEDAEKKREQDQAAHGNNETIWCKSCQCSVSHDDYRRHIQGTAHMVSSQDFAAPSNVLILNSKNIGFKMLETQGWKYEEGLGPKGEGKRQPISTVLKQDRLCIGHPKAGRKVVTHSYKEIEKKAIEKQRLERLRQKPSGKQLAKNAKRETEIRKRLLAYMNQ